jgi:hypothetical protein
MVLGDPTVRPCIVIPTLHTPSWRDGLTIA